jgi:hypothetical protein
MENPKYPNKLEVFVTIKIPTEEIINIQKWLNGINLGVTGRLTKESEEHHNYDMNEDAHFRIHRGKKMLIKFTVDNFGNFHLDKGQFIQ